MTVFNMPFLPWILLLALTVGKISLYRILYAEEECRKGETVTIHLGSGPDNSSGIFKASRDGRQLAKMHCHFVLKPPLSSEVVISVRSIDLMPPINCRSYLELNSSSDIRVRRCGYLYDAMEMESYFSLGDTDLIFHTEHLNPSDSKTMQFEVIFTSVLAELRNKCNNETKPCKNGRCIWKGLVGDGHNNCGDSSDEEEETSYASHEKKLPAGMTLLVIIPIIIGGLALILLLVCCFGQRVTAKIERLIQNEERRNEAQNANTLVQSGSPSGRQNYNTITPPVPSNPLRYNPDFENPRDDVTAPSSLRPFREQPPIRVLPDFTVIDVKKDQLPPYDPPPTYETVTQQTKEKY